MAAPFGASPAQVRALVIDIAAEGARLGARGSRISDDTVQNWIEEGAGAVAARIFGYSLLDPAVAAQVEFAARGLANLYAASMLADAQHPERAGTARAGAGRLGEVYWEKYKDGLESLTGWVAAEVKKLPDDPAVPSDDVTDSSTGVAFLFPPTRLRVDEAL